MAEYGRVDTLINNAGLSMWMKLEDVEDLGSLEYIMRVNFFGSMYCTYYALPHLKRSRGRSGAFPIQQAMFFSPPPVSSSSGS